MLVLAIDTSTPQVTTGIVSLPDVNVAADTDTLVSRTHLDARAHNEVLVPLIVECLDAAGVARADLDAVVVGCGPGPFTGLRVGMVTGAAFADALGIPVFGVCSLDSMAAVDEGGSSVDGSVDSMVVTDARRREVYAARYSGGSRVWGPAVLKAADVPEESRPGTGVGVPALIRGSVTHATQVAEAFGSADAGAGAGADAGIAVEEAYPTPAGLVRAALDEIRTVSETETAPGATAEPAPLVPLYLRRPDAVPPTPRTPSAALKLRKPADNGETGESA